MPRPFKPTNKFWGNVMNLIISSSKILAAALCAAMLAGCNAVEDVADEPTAALPSEAALLGGRIKDLGTRRPVVLQYNGTDSCLVPVSLANPSGPQVLSECQFFGVLDQEYAAFDFGAIKVGTPYNVTVKKQPFGKICTVQNPVGTVRAGGPSIEVTCADDPAVAHYTVTVNIAEAARSKSGLRVILTTENGTCPVDVNGRSTVTFSSTECPDSGAGGYHRNATYLFDSKTSLPVFPWRVTATIPGATALADRTNCYVTNANDSKLVANTGGNIPDNGIVPTGNQPTGNVVAGTITVNSCGFTVRVQADYSRSPTEIGNAAIGDGVTVALRSQPYGVDVAVAKIMSFDNSFTPFMVPDANGAPTGIPYEAQSEPNAFYELVVKQSPAGMACVPGYSTTVGGQSDRSVGANALVEATAGGAVLLRRPASGSVSQLWLLDRVIRCRLAAANPTPLRGAYWVSTKTTTTRTPFGGAASVTVATAYNRTLLTFFEDGQFIYGNHNGSQSTSEGLEQGFYAYNNSASAIGTLQPASMVFTETTDTNFASGLFVTNPGPTPAAGPGTTSRTITQVARFTGPPKRIESRVSDTTVTGLVLAAGGLTVTVNNGTAANVAPATYYPASTLPALRTAINNAAGSAIAQISGTELVITGPIGGVVFGGVAAGALGLPGTVAAGATATSTNVNTTIDTRVNTIVDWVMSEISPDTRVSTTNALDGAWVTWDWQRTPAPVEDRRRIFAYQHGVYNVIHFGMNGIPNLQATCQVGDFGLIGTWTRHGSGQGCLMTIPTDTVTNGSAPVRTVSGNLPSGDIPSRDTTAGVTRDIPGRWPQSQNPAFTDGRPYSLVDYEIRLAGTQPTDPVCPNLDKLTVWDTINGVRKDTLTPPVPRIVLCRIVAN
jgi:hypothetical protein